MEKLLTTEEVSLLLSVKVSNIRAAVFKKKIPFVKIGRLVRFDRKELSKWLQQNKLFTSSQGEE